jgi:hypothetical protein
MATQLTRDRAVVWHISSASGQSGQCVEVATSASLVLVRDSRDRSGTVLAFTQAQWRGLLSRIMEES